MQLRNLEGFFRQIDAQHIRAFARHRVGQNAAATTHVQHTMPVQRCDAVDPFEAQGVDGMQGAELARLVPPAVRQG